MFCLFFSVLFQTVDWSQRLFISHFFVSTSNNILGPIDIFIDSNQFPIPISSFSLFQTKMSMSMQILFPYLDFFILHAGSFLR